MRIVQVNTADVGGGAEQVALELHTGYRRLGWPAELWVGHLVAGGEGVRRLDGSTTPERVRTTRPRSRLVRGIARPGWAAHRLVGLEYFGYPASRHLLREESRPDLLQMHNLHPDYFDLRLLPALTQRAPVTLTLHDAWLTTGHCAQPLDSPRWESGCGQCPHLDTYPAVRRDMTAVNWRRKKAIMARSRLFVTTPSHWLMERVARSLVAPAVIDSRVIPNGVDTSAFAPGDRSRARRDLSLNDDDYVIAVAANRLAENPFKDFRLLKAAVAQLGATTTRRVVVLALGATGADELLSPDVKIRMRGQITERGTVALHLQAADVLAHPAVADTFPTTVLEGMACGLPVVATAVGGIPEQLTDGETGVLVPAGDIAAFARALGRLEQDAQLRERLAAAARAKAVSSYRLDQLVDGHVAWNQEIVSSWAARGATRA